MQSETTQLDELFATSHDTPAPLKTQANAVFKSVQAGSWPFFNLGEWFRMASVSF
jgi:hypothetical protein